MAASENITFPQLEECVTLCRLLHSADKKVRKEALISIEDLLLTNRSTLSAEQFHEVFRVCHIYLLQTTRDVSEQVRDQSLKFLKTFLFRLLPINDYYLSFMFPIMVERLGGVEIVEESEEIRLHILQFLFALMSIYTPTHIRPYVGDCITILKQTLADKYPSIKEYACKTISKLVQSVPQIVDSYANELVELVISTLSHNRYRIRLEAVKCIGDLIQHSHYKILEQCMVPLAERLFDQVALVRQHVCIVVGNLMLEYRDRYSFFHKLIPLMLTGLNDEVKETRVAANRLWSKIGDQYASENTDNLKSQRDVFTLAPAGMTRPSTGCRALVQRHFIKIVKPMTNELQSWQSDVRYRCSQLMYTLVQHAEGGIIQYLHDLLKAMYAAVFHNDDRVVVNVITAAELIAKFVPIHVWLSMIQPEFNPGNLHYGHLAIFAAFIKGTAVEELNPYIEEFVLCFSDYNILLSRDPHYLCEMATCVRALMCKYNIELNTSRVVGQKLFNIVIVLISIKRPGNIDINDDLLGRLQSLLRFDNSYKMWHKYLPTMLTELKTDSNAWMEYTYERTIFGTLLAKSEAAFGENLVLVSKILKGALHQNVDIEARLNTFYALSNALEDKDIIFAHARNVGQFLRELITGIFVPSLVWQPGRLAAKMRSVVAACLASALTPKEDVDLFESKYDLRVVFDEVLPHLISMMQDTEYRSRTLAVENMVQFKNLLGRKSIWETADLLKIYPEVVKAVDDPTERVRVCALKALKVILMYAPNDFNCTTFYPHHDGLIDTMFMHYDDSDPEISELVLEIFKQLATINGPLLGEKTDKYKTIVRSVNGCADIIAFLQEMGL